MPQGGRSLETPLFPYGELGEWEDRVHISPYYPTLPPHDRPDHARPGGAGGDHARGDAAPRRQRRARDGPGARRAAAEGPASTAASSRRPSHRGVDLIMEDGKVAGVVFETPEGRKEVRAPNVVIATGGFEHNAELKRAFLRGPCTHTVAVETNTGDGLKMAMRAGAMLGNMREAWWMPMIEVPDRLVADRPAAADLRADAAGRDHGQPATASASPTRPPTTTRSAPPSTSRTRSWASYSNLPCWLVFDQTWLDKYGFAGGLGGTEKAPHGLDHLRPTRRRAWPRSSASRATRSRRRSSGSTPTRASSRIPTSTAAGARRTSGGATRRCATAPRGPRSGRSRTAPYYAIEVKQRRARAPRAGRRPTPARACSTSTATSSRASTRPATPWPRRMGMTYGGAGGTLGPAMIFGYLAGRDIAAARRAGGRETRSPTKLAAAHGGA